MAEAADAYRQLAAAVRGYLRAQGAADPDDILGEVFLQVARDVHRFRCDDDALRRWVFAIARNRLLDDRRRRSRRPSIDDREPPDAPTRPPVEPVDAALVDALARLTDEQREVIALRFIADLSLETVARLTRRRVGAVKAMQHRALEQLARILGADDGAVTGDERRTSDQPAPPPR
jgi:RNA polymerase sigma-70 factor (ECF subfamily)